MPAEDPAPGDARELAQLAPSPIAVLRARWRGEFRTISTRLWPRPFARTWRTSCRRTRSASYRPQRVVN